MARTLHDEWTSYAIRVLPLGCSDAQRQETRRAFYAGALAHQHLLSHHSGADDAPESEIEAYVLGIDNEFREFYDKVKKGQA